MTWFRKASDRGLTAAENNMRGMYDTGKGVRQDAAEAVTWYHKGANHTLPPRLVAKLETSNNRGS